MNQKRDITELISAALERKRGIPLGDNEYIHELQIRPGSTPILSASIRVPSQGCRHGEFGALTARVTVAFDNKGNPTQVGASTWSQEEEKLTIDFYNVEELQKGD